MTETTVKDHPVHGIIKSILECQESQGYVDALNSLKSNDASWIDKRILSVTKIVKNLIDETPSLYISIHGLNSMQTPFQNILNEMTNFVSNKSAANLTAAGNLLDQSLMQQMWAFLPSAKDVPAPVSNIVEAFRTSTQKAIDGVKRQAETASSDIQGLQQQWTSKQEAINTAITAQEARLAELSDAIEADKQRSAAAAGEIATKYEAFEKVSIETFAKTLAELNTRYETFDGETRQKAKDQLEAHAATIAEQAARLRELADLVEQQRKEAVGAAAAVETAYAKVEKELRDNFSTALTEMSGIFKSFDSDSRESAKNLIAELEARRDEAAKIVQIVGNIGVTGNYQKIAQTEGRAANFWRWGTVGFFGVGVVLAIVAFAHQWDDPSPIGSIWPLFLMRFATAVAISLPAFYTARESARHRTNADRARQRELELASIGPFIALLPEDARNEITKDLTKQYFGGEVSAHEITSPISATETTGLIEAVAGLVSKVKP